MAGFARTLRSRCSLSILGKQVTDYENDLSNSSRAAIRIARNPEADLRRAALEERVTLGCILTQPGAGRVRDARNGIIVASKTFLAPAPATGPIAFDGTDDGSAGGPVAIVQNLVEVTHMQASAPGLIVGIYDVGDISRAVILHNIGTGTGSLGKRVIGQCAGH